MEYIFLILIVAGAILTAEGYSLRPMTIIRQLPAIERGFYRLGKNVPQKNECPSRLFMSSDDTENILDDLDERFLEEHSSPMEQFLTALKDSIDDQSLLKLTLSENDSTNSSSEENENEINDENENENEIAVTGTAPTIEIDMDLLKEWAAISGRLIKTKKESKLQLISYNDKSMKKSSQTKNYISSIEAVNIISAYIVNGFKKAMLSTRENDFEFKHRKGGGKFRATSKGFEQVDPESVISESLTGVTDPATLRRILEDRRLLLLSDPSNQEYKVLYAEIKRKNELLIKK